jgi:hypothetical protein
MYAGAVWLFVGMPLALGSSWSFDLIVPFMPVLLWRLLDEAIGVRAGEQHPSHERTVIRDAAVNLVSS